MEIKEFLNLPIRLAGMVSNCQWVKFEGFNSLYVRHGKYLVYGEFEKTIQLANITATNPGNGAFKNLVDYLQKNFDESIIVESVLSEQFATGLLRMGFTEFSTSNFVLKHGSEK